MRRTQRLFLPRRILALGLTWRSHAKETGERIDPRGPAIFTRDPASLADADRVVIPSRRRIEKSLDALEPGLGAELKRRHREYPKLFDYEIEIAFTVLEDGSLAWMLANDLTVRTVQILGEGTSRRMDFWSASKSFPSTLLLGTPMVLDEGTPDLELLLRVDEEVRQRGRTTELAYSTADLRRFAGSLEPGDVVLTGTPSGVAFSVPRWKRALAELVFDRWGKLKASFRAARGASRFLHAGAVIDMEGGPLGALRAVVAEEHE
jgi:2-keto-4-pentenoate hydratase/2-oxohepta-3-ene-1,7-dioic acid hydratase in catechol pathway